MTTTTTWHKTPPDESGLYIASTPRSRNANYVRYWTGLHWTPPLHVADMHLTDRIPNARGCVARDAHGHRVRVVWLRAYAQ